MFFPKFPILIFQFLGYCGFLREQWGEFITLNSSGIVYPYDSVLIGTLVMVSIYLFFTLLFGSYCPEFFELTSMITITVLTPVSCNYMVSLASGGKKSGAVSLTCRCHMSYTMPDIIFQPVILFCFLFCFACFLFLLLYFHFSMGWFYFCNERGNYFYQYNTNTLVLTLLHENCPLILAGFRS